MVLCVCSFTIETNFPLSNLQTKHIFGIHMDLRKYEDHLEHLRRPIVLKTSALRRLMRIPNMCLVLKLDNGKVVSIADEQTESQTDRITNRQNHRQTESQTDRITD